VSNGGKYNILSNICKLTPCSQVLLGSKTVIQVVKWLNKSSSFTVPKHVLVFSHSQPTYYIFYVIQCCDLHYLPVWKRAWLTDKTLKNTDTSSLSACSSMYFLPEYLMQNLIFPKLQYQTEGHSVYNQSHCIKKTGLTVCAGHLLFSEWKFSVKYKEFFFSRGLPTVFEIQ